MGNGESHSPDVAVTAGVSQSASCVCVVPLYFIPVIKANGARDAMP
jgi:hypothetical protein